MPNWLYAIPALFFFITGLLKYAKSGGQKIVMLGDFIICLGFLYQLVFPSQIVGFIIAAGGVIVDFILFSIVAKNTRERQQKENQDNIQE
ncbi:MAG TPA: hypothetical protein PK466_14125 [Thermotogota bacterium]|nr:hypothetical protein [Thermotogota bacterium]HPJ88028.1 hypothetical protein [Thermotogota bacterium]HPR97464.1 hypothetical protein [Thermotogota bacterium]